MIEEMEKDTIEIAMFAIQEHDNLKHQAAHIKREMDKRFRCVKAPRRAATASLAASAARADCHWRASAGVYAESSLFSRPQPDMARGCWLQVRLTRLASDEIVHLLYGE